MPKPKPKTEEPSAPPRRFELPHALLPPKRAWTCAIGALDPSAFVPESTDHLLRAHIKDAFELVTHQRCEYLFSGWGAEEERLTEGQRVVVLAGRSQAIVYVQLWTGTDGVRVSLHYDRIQRDLHFASVALLGLRTADGSGAGLTSGPCVVSIDIWNELVKLTREANKTAAWFESADQAIAFLGGGSSAARPIL